MQGTMAAKPQTGDRRILIAALILGAIAAGLIVAYLSSLSRSSSSQGIPMASVVVARDEIPAGKKLTDGMIELKEIPQIAVTKDAITSKSQVVGQTLRYPVAKGEQIGTLRLVDTPKVQTISFQIPAGLRGMTVPVNVNNSPAALLAPGDFVDVIASVELKSLGQAPQGANQNDEPHGAVTLIQNAQVLSVQRQYVDNGVPYDPSVRGLPPKDANITYVTLAVTPEQAQLLALAVDKAKLITMSLRAFGDDATKDILPVTEPLRLR